MDEKDQEEVDGVKAIIALQKVAGITETEEQARNGWRGMSANEKKQTMAAFWAVCVMT